jgi:hypothetical protein
MLFLAMTGEAWGPAIGDPTFMGWFTVFAYGLAALLCWCAATRHRGSSSRGREEAPPLSRPGVPASDARLWIGLSGFLVLLGINKQLDLQSWFTEVGRTLARSEGWYEHRQTVQTFFVIALAAGGLAALLTLAWITRRTWRTTGLAVAGTGFVMTFVVIRAASFYHVDALLGWEVLGIRLSWVLEIGGIACVAVAALNAQHSGSAKKRLPFDR